MGTETWILVSTLGFRSLDDRILKINLEDNAVDFWSSWKRHHKTGLQSAKGGSS